jgi:hypothetical protein
MHTCTHQANTLCLHYSAEPAATDTYEFMRWGHWTDEHYVRYLRVRRSHFDELCSILRASLSGKDTNWKQAVSVELKVAVTLMKLSQEGVTYAAIRLAFGIAGPTVCKCVHQVVYAIVDVMRQTYVRRMNAAEAAETKAAFKAKGFPNCLGAIDGTHFKIRRPHRRMAEDYYCLRKAAFTLQMQGVCNHKGFFWDVTIGHTGSVHDARQLRRSNLFRVADEVVLRNGSPVTVGHTPLTPYILGDGGYPTLPWLVTVYLGDGKLVLGGERPRAT